MEQKIKARFRKTTAIFWLLLIYIVAALIWWFISLELQNDKMLDYKLHQTEIAVKQNNDLAAYKKERHIAVDEHRRNRVKYAGEGIVFLGLILVGALFIFRSIKRQIGMQQQQQNFMMAVTHELKTPIAIAKLNLETLQKYQLDEQRQLKLIKMTLAETKRLDFLTNNILVSSQLDSLGYKINKEELDLSHLLQDRVTEFRTRFPERVFVEAIEEDVAVNGDALLLQILINNLLENAIKYSDKNKTITTVLKQDNNTVILQVIDEGPGVPDAEKTQIFLKFYRVGNEATRRKQGTGLGLYLCAKIAKDHNADIIVTDNKETGSIFTVDFKS